MKRKLPIILFLLASISLVATASAQELIRTFTISPPAVQVSLDPGAKVEGTLKLVNDGNDPLIFQTSMQDFVVKDDQGTPSILPPGTLSNKYSGASWVAVYPDVITVAPHQRAEINYFIQVPLDARPGGHYAAVMYTPTTNVGLNGNGTSVNTSVGTLFYITVKGPVNIKAQLTEFFTKSLWDLGPITVSSSIKNLSDVHVTPKGTITLTNMLGQKSDRKDLASYNIFPGVSRNYETKLGKTFMLGLYKADLKASYGPNNTPLVASASFIVFPWKLAAFVVLMVIVLVIGYKYWKGDIKLPRRGKKEDQDAPSNS